MAESTTGSIIPIAELMESMTTREYLILTAAKDAKQLRSRLIMILAFHAGAIPDDAIATFAECSRNIATGKASMVVLPEDQENISAINRSIAGPRKAEINSAIEAAGGIKAIQAQLERKSAEFDEKQRQYEAETLKVIARAFSQMIAALKGLAEIDPKAPVAMFDITQDIPPSAWAALEAYQHERKRESTLSPYIEAVLPEFWEERPEWKDLTTDEIIDISFYPNGIQIENSPFAELIERALKRMAETTENPVEELERIILKPVKSLLFPLDKVNSSIWEAIASAQPNGQLQLKINTTPATSKKRGDDLYILYSLNFAELDNYRITRQLTAFDKRCYIAAGALYNGGNEYMTTTQIYKMMGGKGQPSADNTEKINASLTKMGAARVYINNNNETQRGIKYPAFVYDAALLPFERVTKIINGAICESAIHLLREPPLISFARGRKQVTTIQRVLLETPINKTDETLRIEDYLIEQISHIKKGYSAPKILYSTVYANCSINGRKQRERAPAKIKRILDYWASVKWIKGYTETNEGITIEL